MTDDEIQLSSRPRVSLAQGIVAGIEEKGDFPGSIESFKGIPYAQPPVGRLRFQEPVKVQPNPDALIDASRFGPRAPARQFIIIGPKLEESEDCLTVNIFRPKGTRKGAKLPVVLYFHGGAFNRGNAAMHDTGAVVGWSEQPMIGVSFGYRIGALGFLPSRASADMGLLNLGLKDQILMMQWVQENIEHFGGDPATVTLMGLSAGAHSVSQEAIFA
jgi:carboxylesterase type B